MSDEKASLSGLSVVKVFSATVKDVLALETAIDFKGAVDVGVTFNSVVIDKKGLLAALFSGDSENSSTTVKLATRVHLEGQESTPE